MDRYKERYRLPDGYTVDPVGNRYYNDVDADHICYIPFISVNNECVFCGATLNSGGGGSSNGKGFGRKDNYIVPEAIINFDGLGQDVDNSSLSPDNVARLLLSSNSGYKIIYEQGGKYYVAGTMVTPLYPVVGVNRLGLSFGLLNPTYRNGEYIAESSYLKLMVYVYNTSTKKWDYSSNGTNLCNFRNQYGNVQWGNPMGEVNIIYSNVNFVQGTYDSGYQAVKFMSNGKNVEVRGSPYLYLKAEKGVMFSNLPDQMTNNGNCIILQEYRNTNNIYMIDLNFSYNARVGYDNASFAVYDKTILQDKITLKRNYNGTEEVATCPLYKLEYSEAINDYYWKFQSWTSELANLGGHGVLNDKQILYSAIPIYSTDKTKKYDVLTPTTYNNIINNNGEPVYNEFGDIVTSNTYNTTINNYYIYNTQINDYKNEHGNGAEPDKKPDEDNDDDKKTDDDKDDTENSNSGFFTGIIDKLKEILDFLNGLIKKLTDMFVNIFVPKEGYFDEKGEEFKDSVSEKMPFFYDMFGWGKETFKQIEDDSGYSSEEGEVYNPLPVEIGGQTVPLVDFSYFDQYRSMIHGVIILLAYLRFSIQLMSDIGDVLSGRKSEKAENVSVIYVRKGKY